MKRWICALCAFILLATCGCSQSTSKPVKPVNFYYKTDPDNYQANAITPETRESKGYEDDLKGLIQLYINGPISKTYLNPFPQKTVVDSITVNTTTVDLQLNAQFAQLSDLDMTTACACLTMTILEITQRHRLIINAVDESGNIIYTISMTKDYLLLCDYG